MKNRVHKLAAKKKKLKKKLIADRANAVQIEVGFRVNRYLREAGIL